MIARAPQIGFDRFVQLDWVAGALAVRAGKRSLQELIAQLADAGLGKEALVKTRTKLNALVLEPRPELADFVGRGAKLAASDHVQEKVTPFAWGAALATYPYFAKIAEITGRLTSIQGDCLVAEVHRRVSEVYGDREITKRATQAVLQTQANWGAVTRVDRGKRLIRLDAKRLSDRQMVAWLVEAVLRHRGKALSVASLQSIPELYPFASDQPLAYLMSQSELLELRMEGTSQQVVALKSEQ